MTVAQLAPHAAVCALLAVAAWLLLRKGHRGRARPGHGRTRPHSRHVGTAQQDHDAIKEHDMTLHLAVRCDRSGPTGLCRESLQTSTDDEAEAIAIATNAGWDMGGDGTDICPNHATEEPTR